MAFAERLKQAGKPAKVVIVACMRKLLTIMNAMLKNNALGSYKARLLPRPQRGQGREFESLLPRESD